MVAALLLAACSGNKQAATTPAASCDRACLESLIDRVLAGMLAHDAGTLPTTANFRYIENNQPLRAGEGSWKTLQSFGTYRHYFADPESGNAALITTMQENDGQGLFTLRIKAVGGKLAEAEAIVTHDPLGAARYARLGKPADAWLESVPEDERMTREALAATANKYFGSIENNDGKGDYSFFDDDCNRLEHGLKTTNTAPQKYGHSSDTTFVTLGCRGQFETGFLGFVTRVRDRRYEVIDGERGVVFSIAPLDHDGTTRSLPLTNGKTFKVPTYFSASRTLQVGEAFRARDGRITDIEMTLHEFPYGMRTGFRSTFDPPLDVPGGEAPEPGKACDSSCLESHIDQVAGAMAAHDPKRALLADRLRYTENDQLLAVGDGLWGTLTDLGSYRIHVADATSGQVSLLARVTETDLPGLLWLRARVVGGRVTEVEATVVREERPSAEELFRPRQPVEAEPAALNRAEPLLTQPVPPAQRAEREQLLTIVNRYFDALEQGQGGDVPFTADCLRRENGVTVTQNPDLPRPTAKGRDPGEMQWEIAASGEVPRQTFKPYALDCGTQLNSGYSAYIGRIRDRRARVTDEERGLISVTAYYDIPGTVRTFTSKSGVVTTLPPVLGRPYTLATQQLFRIVGGEIQRIEALNKVQPYGARPAWVSNHNALLPH